MQRNTSEILSDGKGGVYATVLVDCHTCGGSQFTIPTGIRGRRRCTDCAEGKQRKVAHLTSADVQAILEESA